MARIERGKGNKFTQHGASGRKQVTCTEKERNKVYNSAIWRTMRKAKLMRDPLCECCVFFGRTAMATDVHHLDSFTGHEGADRLAVAYDVDNLMSVCKWCHWQFHHGRLKGIKSKKEFYEKNWAAGEGRQGGAGFCGPCGGMP